MEPVIRTLNDMERELLKRRYGAMRDAQLVERAIMEILSDQVMQVVEAEGLPLLVEPKKGE